MRLTPTEWQMLEVLVRNPRPARHARDAARPRCGDRSTPSDTGYLRLYLSQLRKKLEPEPSEPVHLMTEPGMGYRFVPGSDAQ